MTGPATPELCPSSRWGPHGATDYTAGRMESDFRAGGGGGRALDVECVLFHGAAVGPICGRIVGSRDGDQWL